MPWQRPMRWWRHAITDRADVARAFPPASLDRVERAIGEAEARHAGQIVFAVEPALPVARVLATLPPRERALEVFGLLRVWDTEHNNGVLVYVLLADRDVEIVADRGIAARVAPAEWESVCRAMEGAFRAGRFEQGALEGIRAVGGLLARHYPGRGADTLSNAPHLL